MSIRAAAVAVNRVNDIIHADFGVEDEDLLHFVKGKKDYWEPLTIYI